VITIDAGGIDYFVFGGHLRSQLEIPDLSPAQERNRPDWELAVSAAAPPESIELLGTREVEPGWEFRLHRVADGLRLDYRGTGSYCIHAGGSRIVWHPDPESNVNPDFLLEMARAILLGPVMALALHQAGILCLHGSAVTIGGRAVAFLAPKLHGKSTLALALTDAGARFLTDDLVAIDVRATPVVLPGVHSVRLRSDTARRLGERFARATLTEGYKQTLTNLPRRALGWEPAPLAAVYLVRPTRAIDDGKAVAREAMPATRAAVSMALEKKLTDDLIGLREAGSMLQWIGDVVSAVPVYRLSLLRDLERLPDVVRELMAWHGAIPEDSIPEAQKA